MDRTKAKLGAHTLLWVVVSLYQQGSSDDPPPLPSTGVRLYLGVHNKSIPNYAMIAARDFRDTDGIYMNVNDNVTYKESDGLNDGLWCQSANNGNEIGSWQFPNGEVVGTVDSDIKSDHSIYSKYSLGQVGLLRDEKITIQGMYTCTIPDETGVNQTLVVWAERNKDYDSSPSPMSTAVLLIPSDKPRDTDPPDLLLSFNVSIAPPTYVTCQVNCTPVDVAVLYREVITEEQISNESTQVTSVIVTLRMRQPGNYQCNVSVFRASGSNLTNISTIPITVSVTDTPTDVKAVRTGYDTVQLSWNSPPSNTPQVAGYEVFYTVSGSDNAQSGANTTSTNATVSGLLLEHTYYFFVVAYSEENNTLPSFHSNNDSVYLSTQTPSTEPRPPIVPQQWTIVRVIIFLSVTTTTIVVVLIVVMVLVKYKIICQSTSKQNEVRRKHQQYQFSRNPGKENEVTSKKQAMSTTPVIEIFPSTKSVKEGQQVEFKFTANGIPSNSSRWYDDIEPITEGNAHVVTEKGSPIMMSEQKHSWEYKPMVENSDSKTDESIFLIVIEDEEDEDSAQMVLSDDFTSLPIQLSLDAIPVADFGKCVANCHANYNKGFHNLYSRLASREAEYAVPVAITPINEPLNSLTKSTSTVYDDDFILSKSIIGQSDCQMQGDYISASYIDGYYRHNQYIVTQGPMSNTLVDFWQFVWQEKPQAIVMITNLMEETKTKCQVYWPETGIQSFGPFCVTLTEQRMFTDCIIRFLQVDLPGSSECPHDVSQFHFVSWPDHGIPDYAAPILTLRSLVKQIYQPKKGPMLIHCSAGVGQTGTFIAIDMALDKIEKEGLVDISNIIIKLWQQKMKMVQTVDQFIFICDAILESITCADTQILASDLRLTLKKLHSVDPLLGKTGFQHQFDVLSLVSLNPTQVKHSTASKYPDRNRTLHFAPSDKYRVRLKGDHHDYISATFVNGYEKKKAFIVAQSPMQNTCRDFWKMITDRRSGVIIMLCQTQENGQETCAQYWPNIGEKKIFGEFLIELQKEVEYPGFVERNLAVLQKDNGDFQKVLQFHITNWTCYGGCSNLKTIVSVLREMYKVQYKTGNHPVVVHCSDTVSRSGMFCVIATVIDRCKSEGLVDVFQVVKAQRMQKPGMICDVAQYEVVFDVILAFLESFETYVNLK